MRIRIGTQITGMLSCLLGALFGVFNLISFEEAVLLLLFGISLELFAQDN